MVVDVANRSAFDRRSVNLMRDGGGGRRYTPKQ